MEIFKCGMKNCNQYISEDEAKLIKYNGKTIHVCEVCDDGSFEEIKKGDYHESTKKIEKIRKTKKRLND